MKTLFFIVLLLSTQKILLAQQVYTIPWATKQPKFVFPIYFEEASGMRDTIYFCFDPQAHNSQPFIADTIFGQKLIKVDTTGFYAFIQSNDFCNSAPLQCDSQYKVSISSLSGTGQFPKSWMHFGFRNGLLPLKISWDISTLYSDSLPFPLNPGLPRAQGRFNTLAGSPFIKLSENGQLIDVSLPYNILITDTGGPSITDSCTVYSIDGNSHPVEEIQVNPLYFESWTGVVTSIESKELKDDFKIFPNPCNSILNFESELACDAGKIQINDLSGRIVFSKKISPFQMVKKISLDLSEGVYIFSYSCQDYFYNKLFLFSK